MAGSTSNQASHLLQHHQICHPNLSKGAQAEKPDKFWSPEELQSIAKLMAKCFALDRLPPYWVERPGFNALMQGLLGSSFTTPCHGTIARHQDTMLQEMQSQLQQELSDVQLPRYPLLTLSTDLWEGPDGYHYVCVIVHYIGGVEGWKVGGGRGWSGRGGGGGGGGCTSVVFGSMRCCAVRCGAVTARCGTAKLYC